jgi:hypothetical protein
MSNEQLAAALGDGWQVKDGEVIPVVRNTVIGSNVVNPVFNGARITAAEPDGIMPGLTPGTDGDCSVIFKGTYDPVEIGEKGDNTKLYLSANTLYCPNGAMTFKPFRAYFQLNTTASVRAYKLNFGDDGVCTRCHGCIVLSDTEDCGEIIYESDGLTANVKLEGRTLYKDGSWNTICLPFDVTIAGSVLDGDGVQVRQLNEAASNLKDGLLTLTFEDVPGGVLKASKPYLIKWENTGKNLESPTFKDVTFTTSMPGFDIFDGGFWQGNFSPVSIDEDNIDEILLLSADNKMGYSQEPRMLHSFRAHVEITAESDGGAEFRSRAVTRSIINFGDGETTGIVEVKSDDVRSGKFDDGWYDLQGRKLNGEPVRAGVYIHKGKKVKK